MGEIVSLAEAVSELVRDGDTVALGGYTHLIPHVAGHELIRQKRRDLTFVRMSVAEDFGQTRAPMPGELAALRALKTKGKP